MRCKRYSRTCKRIYPGGVIAPDDGSDDNTSDTTYTESQLNAMTKAQLLEVAQSLGIEGLTDSNTKAEIIEAILAAQD